MNDYPISMQMMNEHMQMLSQREQLMVDIACIFSEYFGEIYDAKYDEELVSMLCDAVHKNFPTK